MQRISWKHLLVLGLVIGASITVKASIWQLHPQLFSDSAGYLVPAVSLLDGHGYGAQENGFRTPVYPLFLTFILAPLDHTSLSDCHDAHRAVCFGKAAETRAGQFALEMIVVVQIFLGLATTTILYRLGWWLTQNYFVATLFSAGYALNLATAFWEISILTETLTTLLVTLSVYLTVRIIQSPTHKHTLTTIALGIATGLLALCQPAFLLFWIVVAAFLFTSLRGLGSWHVISSLKTNGAHRAFAALRTTELTRAFAYSTPVIAIPLLLLGSWSTFNYFTNGSFSTSTVGGFVLMQMVAPAMEKAPPEYHDLTAIYIRYRDALIRETGSYSGTTGRAWHEMLQARGGTWTELSRTLTKLSIYLILADPASYLNTVRESWVRFWEFAVFHYDPIPSGATQLMTWFIDTDVQRSLTVLFWITPLLWGIILLMRRRYPTPLSFTEILLVMLTVWFAAVMVSMLNYGINARYRTYVAPLQYGTIVWTIWAGWSVMHTYWKNKREPK